MHVSVPSERAGPRLRNSFRHIARIALGVSGRRTLRSVFSAQTIRTTLCRSELQSQKASAIISTTLFVSGHRSPRVRSDLPTLLAPRRLSQLAKNARGFIRPHAEAAFAAAVPQMVI